MKVTQPKKKAAPTPEKRSKILLPKGLTYQYDDEAIKNFYSNPGQSEVRLRHPTLIPNKENKLYSLRLKLAVDVDEGQSVQVIGSIPELGIWQQYKCPMRWTEGDIWVLDEPITTTKPHFLYKYVIMQDDYPIKQEDGLARIADLEALPELKSTTQEFVMKQQQKVQEKFQSMTDKKLDKINKIKNMVLNDEWETYTIKLSVLQPFDKKNIDVRVQGNRPEFDNKVMTRDLNRLKPDFEHQSAIRNLDQGIDWIPQKYGKEVYPFEILIKMKQVNADVGHDVHRFEYGYSMKGFGQDDIVYEREPHRIIEL